MHHYKNTEVTFPTRRKAIQSQDIIEFTDYTSGTVVVESTKSSRRLGYFSSGFVDCRVTRTWELIAKSISFKSIY